MNSLLMLSRSSSGADLRAAAMHDDRIHAGLLDEHDVLGEVGGKLGVAHGVAAIFHHHGLLVVALHVRQRLRQHLGIGMDQGEQIGCGSPEAALFAGAQCFAALPALALAGDDLVLLTKRLIAAGGQAVQASA